MHAVLVKVEIDASRSDEASDLLQTFTIPTVKQQPGFISGTWFRSADRKTGRSLLLFESEDAANATADRVRQGPPEGAPVKFVSAEVFEVMAQA
jgi:quinol monooxygenase YgiN